MTNKKNLVRNSSVIRAINAIGDYWVILIMRAALLGSRRYSEFFDALDITHATLTSRLKRLVATGLLTKSDGSLESNHKEYHLTDKGRDLFRVMLLIRGWQEKWIKPTGATTSSAQLTHFVCGKTVQPTLICAHCGELVHTSDTESKEGPGAGEEQAAPARMQRQSQSAANTQSRLTEALTIVGDRWAAMILAASFRGSRRFDEYRLLLKISPQILSKRLAMLVELGMLERQVYQQAPNRYEYRLTDKSIDFYPVIVSLMTWGDQWLAGKKGPPVILHHTLCGKRLKPVLACSDCHEVLQLKDISLRTE